MGLSPEEIRVLGCLIEKETTVPDSYPMTLNSLRLACNQSTNRDPIVAFDDRTVDAALLSLKSQGLVRFVHASHGARTVKYRHVADERWHLERPELAVLSVLLLRGPQTVGELRQRADRQHPFEDMGEVEAALDSLAARTPDPFVVRLDRRPGERDARWLQVLSAPPPVTAPSDGDLSHQARQITEQTGVGDLGERVGAVERRLAAIEDALGIDPAD
jgi:uncharacterized protein YceH (UPF0502 family)